MAAIVAECNKIIQETTDSGFTRVFEKGVDKSDAFYCKLTAT